MLLLTYFNGGIALRADNATLSSQASGAANGNAGIAVGHHGTIFLRDAIVGLMAECGTFEGIAPSISGFHDSAPYIIQRADGFFFQLHFFLHGSIGLSGL